MNFTPEQDQYMQVQMTRAYYQGVREGLQRYAHWRDGEQYVGTTGRTLKQAYQAVDQDEALDLARFDKLKQL